MEHLKRLVTGLSIVSVLCLVAGWTYIGYEYVTNTQPNPLYVLVSIAAVTVTYTMGYLARLKF